MSPLVLAVLATLCVSAISLVGVFFFFADWNERRALGFVSFAAGVLLATAFLEMLPEAVEHGGDGGNFFIATLAAMTAFFLIERWLHTADGHDEPHAASPAYFVLIGSTLHNFIDGVVIGASFMVGPGVGAATTLAVAAHEIPHEAADFGVLLHGGFTRRTALLLNFLSGLAAVLGALWCFWFAGLVERRLAWFLAATAGMFIYIAASDLLPALHHSPTRSQWRYAAPFFVGVALIAAVEMALPH